MKLLEGGRECQFRTEVGPDLVKPGGLRDRTPEQDGQVKGNVLDRRAVDEGRAVRAEEIPVRGWLVGFLIPPAEVILDRIVDGAVIDKGPLPRPCRVGRDDP